MIFKKIDTPLLKVEIVMCLIKEIEKWLQTVEHY